MKHAMLATLLTLTCTSPTLGQQTPAITEPMNMIGTWVGDATAAFVGSNPYRPTEGDMPNLPDAVQTYTFVIDQQKGNRFSGKLSSGTRTETLIGALSPDGKSGVMLDDDGEHLLSIQGVNTIDDCYHHSNQSSVVVACFRIQRSQ